MGRISSSSRAGNIWHRTDIPCKRCHAISVWPSKLPQGNGRPFPVSRQATKARQRTHTRSPRPTPHGPGGLPPMRPIGDREASGHRVSRCRASGKGHQAGGIGQGASGKRQGRRREDVRAGVRAGVGTGVGAAGQTPPVRAGVPDRIPAAQATPRPEAGPLPQGRNARCGAPPGAPCPTGYARTAHPAAAPPAQTR